MTRPLRSIAPLTWICLLSVVLGGCGESDDTRTLGDWTLKKNGLTLTEDLRVAETKEFYFGSIRDLDVTSGGHIVVADPQAHDIKVLRPNGTLLDTLGGPGEGPGEFQRLRSVQVARGDSIYAFDLQKRRLTVFAPPPTYDLARTVTISAEKGYFVEVRVLGKHLVGSFTSGSVPEEGVTNPDPHPWRLIEETGTPSDTLMLVPRPRVALKSLDGGGFRVAGVPFDRSVATAVGPDARLYHGWTDSLHVVAHAPNGTSEVAAALPTEPVPVTEAARDSALEEVNSKLRSIVASAVPDTKPAFTDLVVADDGRLWVRRPPEGPSADATRWWVLDPETKTIHPIQLPREVRIEAVQNEKAYGSTTTEAGAPALVRYQIQTGS
ncbi:MAG: hypothetical protein ABEL04_06230 [Salinibacter sp.]|uniref:hypothetical protein n=1 Tax=Salinibacter sp. TaxID=2065818 RepID=UPI0035D4F711